SDETLHRILELAEAADPNAGQRKRAASLPYASPETARLVDEIAVELALAELRKRYPTAHVENMPHNNPGYDIRVKEGGRIVRYVEVKGSLRPEPHFFMSEGERLFSHANDARYSLLVLYGIDRAKRTGSVLMRDGAVEGDAVTLRTTQWEG